MPTLQKSAPLQNAKSLQGALLTVKTQPLAGMQKSSVQTFPSMQTSGDPGMHTPPEQMSLVVQALASLHAEPLGSAAPQLSAPSLHDSEQFASPSGPTQGLPPWRLQLPPLQKSAPLQNAKSLQGALLIVKTQPMAELQLSSVQTFPSLQTTGSPGMQAPPEQTSPSVQMSPSLQGSLLLAPGMQAPPEQTSIEVQTFPSSQGAAFSA
jgi:hypothetical protein